MIFRDIGKIPLGWEYISPFISSSTCFCSIADDVALICKEKAVFFERKDPKKTGSSKNLER